MTVGKAFNDRQAAEFLGVAVQTLRNYRHLCKGPPYTRVGRRIVYLIQDLESYQMLNRVVPEQGAEK